MTEQVQQISKVFISYSRRDEDFTRQLYDGLERYDLVTWVDWEGIPLTADWMEEITDAIETADAFIFVISPDSVDSEVCNQELNIALSNNKRLVPVLHRELTKKQMENLHPDLAATNWVFMRKKDEFDTTLKQMVQVINTDLDWVKEHTRLLERALEWDRKQRNSDFTLRGADLEEAEHWLASSEKRQPTPTFLHNEYVLISRREYAHRQRRALFATLGLLVIAILASIIAVFQWQYAERQKEVAIARVLAARSIINLESAPDQALLLALQAGLIHDSPEAHTSLLTALAENPELNKFLHGHANEVYSILFIDGQQMVTAGDNGEVFVWDIASGQRLRRLPVDDPESSILTLTLNPDGSLLAGGDSAGSIIIWDFQTGNIQAVIPASAAVNSLAFSPEGDLVAASGSGEILLVDIDEERTQALPIQHQGAALAAAFSPDGRYLASGGSDSDILIWDFGAGTVIRRLSAHSGEVNALVFSPDGHTLYSAGRDGYLHSWDIFSGIELSATQAHSGNILSLSISQDGTMLASGGEDQRVILWDLNADTPEALEEFTAHTNFVRSTAFNPQGDLLSSASSRTVILWNTGFSGFGRLSGHQAPVRRVAYSPNGAVIASAAEDSFIHIWNAGTGKLLRSIPVESGQVIFGMAFSGNGEYLISASGNGLVEVWDWSSGNKIDSLLWQDAFLVSVAANHDASLVAVSAWGQDTVRLWNRESGETSQLSSDSSDPRNWRWVDFSPDGSILAGGSWEGGMVILWDAETGDPLLEWQAHPDGPVTQVVFDPTGSRLATASFDSTAAVWDIETGQQVLLLQDGHSDFVHTVAFSPDGSQLATGSEDTQIILWDLVTGGRIATLSGHDGAVISLDFNRDGTRVVSGSTDTYLIVWDIDLDRAGVLACERANRNLTYTEWQEFTGLNAGEYQATCPSLPLPTE